MCVCVCVCVCGHPMAAPTPLNIMNGLRPARGGLVFQAHRLLYHSTLGLRVIKREEINSRRESHNEREEIVIELMTSDRKLKASREGSKRRNYGTYKTW